MDRFLADLDHEFRRHKRLADQAMAALDDAAFFHRPTADVNPIALIVKHLAGNLLSRWTDFLTTDGEKPTRDRDREFVLTEHDTRAALRDAWERGWQALLATLGTLRDGDLDRTVAIRGEPHTVRQALSRGDACRVSCRPNPLRRADVAAREPLADHCTRSKRATCRRISRAAVAEFARIPSIAPLARSDGRNSGEFRYGPSRRRGYRGHVLLGSLRFAERGEHLVDGLTQRAGDGVRAGGAEALVGVGGVVHPTPPADDHARPGGRRMNAPAEVAGAQRHPGATCRCRRPHVGPGGRAP